MDKLNVAVHASNWPAGARDPEQEADFSEEQEDGVFEVFEFFGACGFGEDGARSLAIHIAELS